MNTREELNYRLYVQRDEEFVRTDVRKEFSRYEDIVNGSVEKVKENYAMARKDFFAGKGVLSPNPLRNSIYHLVVAMGVIRRRWTRCWTSWVRRSWTSPPACGR